MSSPSPSLQENTETKRIELYTHEPMINWLGPGQLLLTGLRAAVAATFGSFSDGRQIQAALHPASANPPIDLSRQETMWLDFVADTGDGWNSTYSIAYSISREALSIAGMHEKLPRADLLILGGDQVYPTPAGAGYRTRFLDPFRGAFPSTVPPTNPPDDPKLVAIPGNHDWYDGLRDFVQLFCCGLYIGRWKTLQRTSYYAVKLPHHWWLWGIDLQLDSGIDTQQYEYFKGIAQSLRPGDQIILSPPEPSWIDESERLRRQREGTLADIETQTPRFSGLKAIEQLIASSPARLSLVMAGDLHLYARYIPCGKNVNETPERITCGGGGAYLLGTHDLPDELNFKSGSGEQNYCLETAFPDKATSRGLRNKAWQLPLRNTVFCSLLAAVYLLYAWVLQSASKVPNAGLDRVTLMEYLARYDIDATSLIHVLPRALFHAMSHSPASVLFTLSIIAGAAAFTASSASEKKRMAWIGGGIHGLLHIGLAVMLLWGAGLVNLGMLAPLLAKTSATFVDHPLQVLMFIAETALLGGSLGGLLFGLWMMTTNAWFRWHGNEVFSSQGIADCKSFLRIKLDASGLTIYPLKIETVCRRWKVGAKVQLLKRIGRTWRLLASKGSGARFEPEQPIEVKPIEPPIHIPANRTKS